MFLTLWQHLVYSTAGVETSKGRNTTNITHLQSDSCVELNTTPGEKKKRIDAVSIGMFPSHLVCMLSFHSLLFRASLSAHSGVFRFSQSVVFI